MNPTENEITEALDRCNTIMILIENLLIDHPAITSAHKGDDVLQLHDDLFQIYQELGRL